MSMSQDYPSSPAPAATDASSTKADIIRLLKGLANPVGISKVLLSVSTIIMITKFVVLLFGPPPHAQLLKQQREALAALEDVGQGKAAAGSATADDAPDPLHARLESIKLMVKTTVDAIDASHKKFLRDAQQLRRLEREYVEAVHIAVNGARSLDAPMTALPALGNNAAAGEGANNGADNQAQQQNADDRQRRRSYRRSEGSGSNRRRMLAASEDDAVSSTADPYPLVSTTSRRKQLGFLEKFNQLAPIEALFTQPIADLGEYSGQKGIQWAARTRGVMEGIATQTQQLEARLCLTSIDEQYTIIKELWPLNFNVSNGNTPIYRPLFEEGAEYHPTHEEGLRRWKAYMTAKIEKEVEGK